MRQVPVAVGLPHSEYCRTNDALSTRSTCAPGVHPGSGRPVGSSKFSATTPSARTSCPATTRSVSSSSTSNFGVLTTSASFSAATKPAKVAIGDTFIARKGEGDTSSRPFETLLINSDGDEASTRTGLEAVGAAFTEPHALQGGGLAILRLRRATFAPSIPALSGPKSSQSP